MNYTDNFIANDINPTKAGFGGARVGGGENVLAHIMENPRGSHL